jgi:O-antigen/teichoic acid export membrane protein
MRDDVEVKLDTARKNGNEVKVKFGLFQVHFEHACNYLGVEGFLKNVVILVGGTVLGQLLTIVATPVIAHLYSPHDLGVASVYGSILSFIMIIGCWSFELAIPLPQDDETAVWLTIISTIVLIGMALITGTVLYFFGALFCTWMKVPDLVNYLFLLPMSLCAVGSYQILSYWVIRWQTYGILARTKISQSIGQITIQVGAGIMSEGAIGLMIGDIVGRSSGAISMARQLWKKGVPSIKNASLQKLTDAAYRYRRFPLISSWSGLLNGLGWMYPLIVTYFYGTHVAGWLALCTTIIGSPLSLLSVSFGKVYYGESARLTKEDTVNQKILFRETIKKLVLLIVPVVILGILIAPWLVPIMFGLEWLPIILYMQVLAPGYIFMAVSSPMFNVLDVFERQDMHLVRECMRVPMILGPFIVGGLVGCSALTSVVMYSISTSLFYLINGFLVWRIIHR